jgi:predicted alpha/beta-fold hydrolase
VAAIGAPLDLAAAADDFDASAINLYRSHVLDGLKEIYTAAYQRRPVGLVPHEARALRKIRTWDERIIAPYFGFAGADDYYASQSVGPKLGALRVDALYVGATHDPMIRSERVRPYEGAPKLTSVWESSAGHLGFGRDFDLGFVAPRGLESQVLAWLSR